MNRALLFAFTGIGVLTVTAAVAGLALAAGLWAWGLARRADDNLADIDAPVPYLPVGYPDDHPGWRYLAEAVNAETPLLGQVLEESDFRAWAQELGVES